MTFFEQLQAKHSDPTIAYIEYQLSKQYLRDFAIHDHASTEVKKAGEIQNKINEYLEGVIASPNHHKSFKELLDLKDFSSVISLINLNKDEFDFLGLEPTDIAGLSSGAYVLNLKQASRAITWESLFEIISAENNMQTLVESDEKKKLQEVVSDFHLNSVFFARFQTTEENISHLKKSLTEISVVIEVDKEKIGGNIFNIFFDTERFMFAGYSDQCFENQQKIYLKSQAMSTTLAHEFFHAFDNMVSIYKKLDTTHASNANDHNMNSLINKVKTVKTEITDNLRKKTIEFSFNALLISIDRYYEVSPDIQKDSLKVVAQEAYQDVLNNNWNADDFTQKCKPLIGTHPYIHFFLQSELDLLHSFLHKKIDHNLFYQHAILFDDIFLKEKVFDEPYAITHHELVARSFESYCDFVLRSKGLDNHISQRINHFTPSQEEIEMYTSEWQNVCKDIRDILNKVPNIQPDIPVEPLLNQAVLSAPETYCSTPSLLEKENQPSISSVLDKVSALRDKFIQSNPKTIHQKTN